MSEKISTSTLEILSDSIVKFQQLGGTVDDKKLESFVDIVLHHPKISAREEACDSLNSKPLDMSNVYDRLLSVEDALNELVSSCQAKRWTLRAEMRAAARPCGILMLPDDVLARIFEEVAAAAALDRFQERVGETLGLVCTRFRSLSLALPSLWIHLSLDMETKCVETYLDRSKAVGLTIDVEVDFFRKDSSVFLELVAQHISRWKIFRYEQRDEDSAGRQVTQAIDILSGLEFSSLEHFDFCVRSKSALLHEFDLLGKWNMPKLHHLRLACRHVLPTPKSPFFSSISIRTFELQGRYISLRDLANFLASLPNLVDLRLELRASWEKLPQDHLIFLPNLTHLEFNLLKLELFSDILSSLSLPQVQKLRLEVMDREGPADNWVKAIALDTFATVKDLHLTYEEAYPLSAGHSLDLRLIFERFPAIEHLKLEVPRCWCSDIFDSEMKLPLRSLVLTLRPDIDVYGCFRAAEHCGNIESLEMTCYDWEGPIRHRFHENALVAKTDYKSGTKSRTISWHRK